MLLYLNLKFIIFYCCIFWLRNYINFVQYMIELEFTQIKNRQNKLIRNIYI